MTNNQTTRAIANTERRLSLSMADYGEVIKRPLRILPEELRPAVLRLWVMHKHLAGMDSALPIAGALTVWIEEHGLKTEEAVKIMAMLQSPTKMAEFKFASDLMTALAQTVASTIRDRYEREESRRRHEEYEAARKRAAEDPPTMTIAEMRKARKELAATFGGVEW
jgi:hypothetical protein